MPWRTIRRCVLCAFLGLLTSVVVAWGVVVHVKLRLERVTEVKKGLAAVDGVIMSVSRHGRFGWARERWDIKDTTIPTFSEESSRRAATQIEEHGGAAFDNILRKSAQAFEPAFLGPTIIGPTIIGRLDDVAMRGPPVPVPIDNAVNTWLTRDAVGWPMRALYSTELTYTFVSAFDANGDPTMLDVREEEYHAFVIRWPARAGQSTPDTLVLPYMPRPGLALNTAFYGVLWALMLLAPGAIRRRLRIARGCCTRCGFSLAGQTRPGCPECGDGRRAAAR